MSKITITNRAAQMSLKQFNVERVFNKDKINPLIFFGIIILFLLSIVLFCIYVYPDPIEERERVSSILNLRTPDIVCINIAKMALHTTEQEVISSYNITDNNKISEFSNALSKAKFILPNHPIALGQFLVTVKYKDKTVKFPLTKVGISSYYINIYSDVNSGWNFGTYKSNELNIIMESLLKVRENGTHGKGIDSQ